MNSKCIYYSCCTWLSFQIARSYYNNLHYVWCAPYFDPGSALNPQNSVPPTSSPREIYANLKKEVEAGDRHSAKIAQNIAGLRRGADIKLRVKAINQTQHDEITDILAVAQVSDFKPLLYIIPAKSVTRMLKSVPVKDRAHMMSEEYIIENLPRSRFDAIAP